MIWGWLRKLWPLILGALGIVALVLTGRRNGQLTERLDRAQARDEVRERMRDAVANTRTDRDGVVERMRDGRF